MQVKSQHPRKFVYGVAIGVGSAALVLLLGWSGVLERVELITYDWRMRAAADAASVNRDIVLVEINDTSIRDLEPAFGRWPWPRLAMSLVIDFLNRAPARVVAVDVTFLERQRNATFKIGGDGGQVLTGDE